MTKEYVSTLCFALAILHTFSAGRLQRLSHRFPRRSVGHNLLHLFGEVEVVFGLWAGVYMVYLGLSEGFARGIAVVEALDFTEPAFVFVVMTVCSARPITSLVSKLIALVARTLPIKRSVALYATTMTFGPLLGSFVTEPAAMTVTALILSERYFSRGLSDRLMYASLGLLFVNVSIGGMLTPYAAPPVLMVAGVWHWDLGFMLHNFGWKAVLACGLSTASVIGFFYDELAHLPPREDQRPRFLKIPRWVTVLHLAFLGLIVMASHYLVVFMWLFLFFLGLVNVTRAYQSDIKLREGLLVAFFLGGLVVLGPGQRWWIEPVLLNLGPNALYFAAAAMTGISDNAALTYLGAQVPNLSEASRYALVAGAVVGGGLTVIANAPNPAGYGILNPSFGPAGISPWRLFRAALLPTAIAAACFFFN